ncbi:MAG: glutathione S-transferase family protein [Rhodospirillaceae bacterium]|nr:glutathione S-transferase family protein [Rhodospirillaceae bacterium]
MTTQPITIYGDIISGNCHKVAFVARRCGVPFRWTETSVVRKETRAPEFLALSPAGQVPIVVLSDGRVLAQSNAIMLYLAEGSDLIPTDAYDRAQMMQWLFWEQYSHEKAIAVRRFQLHELKKSESEIDPSLAGQCQAVLTLMNNHLAKHAYFVAGRLTLADIALVAYTRFSHQAGFPLTAWPQVARWVERVLGDLGPLDLGNGKIIDTSSGG